MWLERHPAMTPNVKAESAYPADDRHDRAEEEPDSHRHMLGRFAILCAVAKRTRQRLREGQDRQ